MTDHTRVGEILDEDQPRDAIHIAVASVLAMEKLTPGQNIGFVEGDSHVHNIDVAACERAMSVGIVDPFLQNPVLPGQRFWMFLHPNTITSLRHNWTHPAFESSSSESERAGSKLASEAWLRDFVFRSDCPDYDTLIAAASDDHDKNDGNDGGYTRSGKFDDYLHFGGSDAHGVIPDEFWHHVEMVTGKKIKDRPSQFSCSC